MSLGPLIMNSDDCFVCLQLIPYVLVYNFSVMSGRFLVVRTSTKQGFKCLAQGHNTVPLVRLEQATQAKCSTLPATFYHRPTNETPFELCIAGGPIVTHFYMFASLVADNCNLQHVGVVKRFYSRVPTAIRFPTNSP